MVNKVNKLLKYLLFYLLVKGSFYLI